MNLSSSVLDANKLAPSKTANVILFPKKFYYAFSYIYIYDGLLGYDASV